MITRRIGWTRALLACALLLAVACGSSGGGPAPVSPEAGDDTDAGSCAALTKCCTKAPDTDSDGIQACMLIASEGYGPACASELSSFAPYDHDCK
jgi:hypothetical protein